MGKYVNGLQTTQLEIIPAIADDLVDIVAARIMIVCSGIVGLIPTKTPIAVPSASE
jgi:hypothetical protein